jgi:hypothetical protein
MQLDIMVTSVARGGVQFPGLYTDGEGDLGHPAEGRESGPPTATPGA